MSLAETSRTVASAKLVVVDGVEAVTGYPLLAPTTTTPAYSFSAQADTGMSITSAGDVTMSVASASSWAASPAQNVAFAGAAPTTYGGGSGVMYISDVTVAPVAAPNAGSGGLLYVDAKSLIFTDNTGTNVDVSALAGDLNGPGASTDDRVALFNGTTGKNIKDSVTFQVGATSVLLDGSNTPGAPRYSFTSDPTSGMYRTGADALGFSTAGVLRLQVNASDATFSTPLQAPNGIRSSPSYQFTSGGGVYLNGTTVSLASGGLACMAVSPSGNVALGGGAPSNYASGQGVVYLHNVTTAPTGPSTGGISVYADGDDLFAMTPSGGPSAWSSCVEGPVSATDDAVARFDGTTGTLVQDTSTVTVTDAGLVSVSDGSVSLPAYSFSGDTTSGLYRVGANSLGVAAGGVQRLLVDTQVTSSVVVRGPDGTEGAPAFSFLADTNTGVYKAGTSSVGMSAGGTTGVVASPSRNVSLAGVEATSYGGGEGVLFVNQAATDPTTNPTSAGIIYSSAGDVESLQFRDTAGTVSAINTVVTGPASSTTRALARWDGATGRLIQDSLVTSTVAGDLQAPDGDAATPTYSLVGDLDTGLFRSADDVLGVSVGGTSVVTVATGAVTSAQPVDVPDGLVGAPVLTFTTDTDTGLFRSGANTAEFTSGGATSMTVTLPAGATATNVTLGSSNVDYGVTGGERVVLIDDVAVAPSGTATSGGRLYVSGTSLNYHDDGGGIVDLANLASGPVASTSSAILRWDGAGGQTVQDSGVLIGGSGTAVEPPATTAATPTFAFTAATTTGVYFPSTTSIALATAGTDRLTMNSTAVTVPSQDVHADAGVEIGGASGASYSMATANLVADVQNASGTFAWANSSGPIMETSGLDLSVSNNLVFTEGTETLTIGHDGTDYSFVSGGATPVDLNILVGSTKTIALSSTQVTFVDVITGTRMSSASTNTGSAFHQYAHNPNNRGWGIGINGTLTMSLGNNPGFAISERNNASLGGHSPVGGSGIIALRDVVTPPSGATAGTLHTYNQPHSVVHGWAGIPAGATKRTLFDWGRERARISLSLSSVADATSTNTDGETWTEVDTYNVTGTTTGALATPDDCFVCLTVTAEWASNSTGYRRVSIMRKTTGPAYAQLNSVTEMAVSGTVTGQTVSFFGAVSAANDELTVQVEQTSGGVLDVVLSSSLVRYATDVAV